MIEIRRNLIRSYRLLTTPMRWSYQRRARQDGKFPVVVLFYHRIADRHLTPWTMTNDCFQEQIDWIASRFEMISLGEAQQRMRNGNNPRPACCITFDDGYAENHDQALPYLMRHQIPVTYFVAVDHIVNDNVFPHDQELGLDLPRDCRDSIRVLSQCGVEIGCHTRTHCDFSQSLSDREVSSEVVDATRELEAIIGRPVRYFAVPFGQPKQMDERVFRLAQSIGLRGVCSAYGGLNHLNANPFHLQRIHGDPNFERMKNWLTWDPRLIRKANPIEAMVNRVVITPPGSPAESAKKNQEQEVVKECQSTS